MLAQAVERRQFMLQDLESSHRFVVPSRTERGTCPSIFSVNISHERVMWLPGRGASYPSFDQSAIPLSDPIDRVSETTIVLWCVSKTIRSQFASKKKYSKKGSSLS